MQYEEKQENWKLATLTNKDKEQIQQLKRELGFALIAYDEMNGKDMHETTEV